MAIHLLSQAALDAVLPEAREQALNDGGGLTFIIRSLARGGGKAWLLRYQFDGKSKRTGLGAYPQVSLKSARAAARAARAQVEKGLDPIEEKKKARAVVEEKRAQPDFKELGDAYIKEARVDYKWSNGHHSRQLALLVNHVYPYLGKKKITDISEPQVAQVVRRVWTNGAKETAGRVRGLIREVFAYACGQGYLQSSLDFMRFSDNIGRIKKPKVHHFSALFAPERVGQLMRDLAGYAGRGPLVGCMLRLLPYLGQRVGQVRLMEWGQLDLKRGMWTCPPQIMKQLTEDKNDPRTKPHVVPLPRQAIEILRELEPITGPRGLVFPSLRKRGQPLSDNTVNAALRSLGYDTKTELTGHGFRSMMQTISIGMGYEKPVSDRHLAHKPREGGLSDSYDRATLLPQRTEMVQAYADLLDRWSEEEGPGAPHPRFELQVVQEAA